MIFFVSGSFASSSHNQCSARFGGTRVVGSRVHGAGGTELARAGYKLGLALTEVHVTGYCCTVVTS